MARMLWDISADQTFEEYQKNKAAHGGKSIHDNSRKSHREHQGSGKGKSYRQKITDLLYATGRSMTDREIFRY